VDESESLQGHWGNHANHREIWPTKTFIGQEPGPDILKDFLPWQTPISKPVLHSIARVRQRHLILEERSIHDWPLNVFSEDAAAPAQSGPAKRLCVNLSEAMNLRGIGDLFLQLVQGS